MVRPARLVFRASVIGRASILFWTSMIWPTSVVRWAETVIVGIAVWAVI
jgi:hypothetical protein